MPAKILLSVRGIIKDAPGGSERFRVISRKEPGGWEYHNDIIPGPYSINKAEIKRLLKDTYHVPVGKIEWCEWVKIPTE